MSGFIQSNQIVKLPYANTAINIADSGKIFITPQTVEAAAVIYTLPTVAEGLHYRFINGANLPLSGSVQINTNAAVAILNGSVIGGPISGVALLAVIANTQIRFLTAKSVQGDFIDLTCDGTNWYVDGRSQVGGGITVT